MHRDGAAGPGLTLCRGAAYPGSAAPAQERVLSRTPSIRRVSQHRPTTSPTMTNHRRPAPLPPSTRRADREQGQAHLPAEQPPPGRARTASGCACVPAPAAPSSPPAAARAASGSRPDRRVPVLPAASRLTRRDEFASVIRRGRRSGRVPAGCRILHRAGGGRRAAGRVRGEQGRRKRRSSGTGWPAGCGISSAPRLAELPADALLVVRALPPAAAPTSAELADDLDAGLRDCAAQARGPMTMTAPAPSLTSGARRRALPAAGSPPCCCRRCRFHPSCSAYAIEALQAHGAVFGSWLTLRRLLRCAPWHPGGVDPVPPPRSVPTLPAPVRPRTTPRSKRRAELHLLPGLVHPLGMAQGVQRPLR